MYKNYIVRYVSELMECSNNSKNYVVVTSQQHRITILQINNNDNVSLGLAVTLTHISNINSMKSIESSTDS